jgi:non-ribosomal peptide synthase protein (TIGR01720 family)
MRRRVELLSPEQRSALAGLLHDRHDRNAQRLVAWVVPAEGAAIDTDELTAYLRERLPAHLVPAALVTLDTLPRLPNGKIDAHALPDPLRTPVEESDAFIAPRDARERAMARVWSTVLGLERIGVHDNFFELGGDSILSIQVVVRARREGLQLTADQIFDNQTLAALAASARPLDAGVAYERVEAAPLTPIQAWFFGLGLEAPHHWHQAVWLEPLGTFDPHRLDQALRAVVARHDALRLVFTREGSEWTQRLAPDDTRPTVEEIVLPDCADAEFQGTLDGIMDDVCSRTDLSRGPLIGAAVVRRAGHAAERILICVHHLAVDGVSWGILLEDLAFASLGSGIQTVPPTTSFLRWAQALSRAAASGRFDSDAVTWATATEGVPLPHELDGPFDEASAETVAASLGQDHTRDLVHGAQVEDVLVTALARVLARWSGSATVRFGIERHGREALIEDLDLSRTMGWFTSYFPIVLEVDPKREARTDLRNVKELMRALPARGVSFGVLRYMRAEPIAAPLRSAPEPELVFNYAGRIDNPGSSGWPWRTVGLPVSSRARVNRRRHRIEVNAFIRNGVFHVFWTSSRNQYRRSTIDELLAHYLDEVRHIVRHAMTEPVALTPADFPDAGLRQDELDRLLRELGS